MSTANVGAGIGPDVEADREAPQPEIQVEERRLTLHDFLKTCVKINGSDVHLQAGSVPLIRVDGRARFLGCIPPDDAQMLEFVKQIVKDDLRWNTLTQKGAVDVSYTMDGMAVPRQHLPQPGALCDHDAADHHQDSVV